MRAGTVVEPIVAPNSGRGGIAQGALRPALIALVCALPLLLLASLAQATPSAPDAAVITNPHIHEDSDYLHANDSYLYYGDGMGASKEGFSLAGGAEGVGPDDYVECARAFDCGPFTDTVAAGWECGDYLVTASDEGSGAIKVTLMVSPTGAAYVYYFPYSEDLVKPTSTASPPLYSSEDPIRVGFGSADAESGVGVTRLWYKQGDTGVWVETLASSESETGNLFFFPTGGDDYYYFKTVATDNVGNKMNDPLPGSQGDGFTIYDTQAPTSTAASPPLRKVQAIPVTYTVGADLSGLEAITLHYSFEGSDWAPTAYVSTAISGVLDFEALDGDGVYEFKTIAADNAGNVGDAPSEYGYASSRLDTVPPTATVASPPQVGSLAWPVTWAGDDPLPASGVAVYDVEYREAEGDWQDWLTGTASTDGAFGPSVPITVQNHLTYTFRVRAYDLAGNRGEWSAPVSTLVEVSFTYLPLVLHSTASWNEFFEENDGCYQSYGPLQSGTQYRAYPDDTEDYYFFDLSSPGRVVVDVTSYAPTSSSGTVALYPPDHCGELKYIIDWYGPSGHSHMVLDNVLEIAGRYYVRVYTAEDYSTSQLYTLTVTW